MEIKMIFLKRDNQPKAIKFITPGKEETVPLNKGWIHANDLYSKLYNQGMTTIVVENGDLDSEILKTQKHLENLRSIK